MQHFEGFEYHADHLVGYVPEAHFSEDALRHVLQRFDIDAFEQARVANRNWNAEWEASITPIEIDQFCQIVPHFMAPQPGFEHTLVITPKMAFGTGHHQTTRLMLRQLKSLSIDGQRVLDHGCGTGVLGMLCYRLGASAVDFIDIMPESTDSTRENLSDNNLPESNVLTGSIAAAPDRQYDLLLANINRNVLLAEAQEYRKLMAEDGQLVLSGFLQHDLDSIRSAFQSLGYKPLTHLSEDDWHCQSFALA